MNNLLTYNKFSSLPADLQAEVVDFIDFLMSRQKKGKPENKPTFGSGKGMFSMKADFDEPLEDFKEYRGS